MGKINNGNTLHRGRTSRSLLAVTLAASLAAFSCTTNQNPGNGNPTSMPEMRTAPTSGVTSGGESYTPPQNPPMMSSYSRSEALPSVQSRSIQRRSPDEAAAIMAGVQTARGRFLGVVSPNSAGRPYESTGIQTYQNPALVTNPQLTINSSISSPPTPAITSGLEGTFGVVGAVATGGTTAASTIAGDVTPTTAAGGVPAVGTIAGTTTLPSMASASVPTVTAASTGVGRSLTTGARTTTPTTTTTATTAPATAPAGTQLGSVSAPVRIIRGTSGVTVTNVGTSTTNTSTNSSGRNQ